MARSLFLFGSLVWFYGTQSCNGFNIDERFPVVKDGPTKGSFFGFSVALHKQTEGSKKYLLLAGAPKEKALSLKNVNETGAVYSCPMTTDVSDCSRMDLVTSTDSSEMVEGMWLGVTVASQRDTPGGHVLACGHRYVKIIDGGLDEQRRMVGKCFVRGNDLTYDPNDEWQAFSYEACNPNFDFDNEGLCNLGIAAGISHTDVYIGSPGSYVWQGNVHLTWRDPTPGNSWDSTDKDFRQLDKRYRNSYMGYSVVEDVKLLSRDEQTVVTGSPRDESKGSVIMGSKQDTKLELVFEIPGEQVGSYFGNSLAVTDLNNDNWNDLIVGAPFYFDRKKEQGGAVYIFMNENGSFQKRASLVLTGPIGSAFGFAVAAIGDINQDGFQDFAVGAPFHDTGKVYIWTGSKRGISEEPSQVIEGKSVGDGRFQTFGYSINGGVDMDENRYPDILVGSLDDRIALLRARPVIHISKNFTVEPKIVDEKLCPSGGKPCITVTVCISYTLSNGNRDFKKDVSIQYTVKADMDKRSPRVFFLSTKQGSYSDSLTMSSSRPECVVLELGVEHRVKDKLDPVVFSLNLTLNEEKPKARRALQNLDAFPILSQKQKLTQRTEINFQKECGSDNKCTSNLQLTALYANEQSEPYLPAGQQMMQYSPNVKKVSLLVNVTNLPAPGKLNEDAHQAMLNISLPDTLRFSGWRSEDSDVSCRLEATVLCDLGNPLRGNEKVSLKVLLEISGIDLYTQQIESRLLLSTLSQQDDLYPVPVVLLIENTIVSSLSIDKPQVQTYFSGKVMGESAMVNTSDVGSLVEYNLRVLGQPLGKMGTLAVEFEWPFEVTNGKWLLYLTEIVVRGTSETRCVPSGDVVNMLNLATEVLDGDNDVAQPQIVDPLAAITVLSPRKESYLLECSKGTARCVTFTCPLLNMSTSATILVRSRVWNSTMLEDYANALRVKVKGQATLKLITDIPTIKMESQTAEFTVDIDPVLGEETPYEVPMWIIIVAAVAGVLLLGVISLILWKLGFFERAIYYRIMPKYHGVRIRKEERYQLNMAFQAEESPKKYWITNWSETQH
ncbi:integrin alpha-3b [Aplochiton taeniatus]